MQNFTDQIALTVIDEIDESLLKKLTDNLDLIYQDVESNPLLPLKMLSGVHFCRFVILPGFTTFEGKIIPNQLVYSSNFDDSLDAHLKEIVDRAIIAGFVALFSCCISFNKSLKQELAVEDFIRKNQKKIHTYYRGYRGLTVPIIKVERALYKSIQRYLDSNNFNNSNSLVVKNSIDEYIQKQFPDRVLPIEPKLPTLKSFIIPALIFIGGLLVSLFFLHLLCIFLITIILGFIIAAIYLRCLEINDKELSSMDINYDRITELTLMEDRIIQNQFTHLVIIKKGLFRRTLQKIGLCVLNTIAIYKANQGNLGGITSIHFARWSMIDNGRRLLFFSNFDGTWENYLGDFVDRAAKGLTLAWSNTLEFPRTKGLIFEGATNEPLFKSVARKNQLKTQVWYSAYDDLTVKDIYRNHKIALGIRKKMTPSEIEAWLKLL